MLSQFHNGLWIFLKGEQSVDLLSDKNCDFGVNRALARARIRMQKLKINIFKCRGNSKKCLNLNIFVKDSSNCAVFLAKNVATMVQFHKLCNFEKLRS